MTTRHNDPAAALRERAEELAAAVEAFAGGGDITDDDRATRAADLQRELQALEKEAESARKAEKQPHMDAAKAVDGRYKPIADTVATWKQRVGTLLAGYLRRKDAERRERERQAREAAEAAAREAQAEQNEIRRAEAVAEAERLRVEAERVANARAQVGSQVGGRRAISLRQSPAKVRIVDPVEAARWAWKHHKAEMVELITRLASAAARGGATEIPGCEIYREESVA